MLNHHATRCSIGVAAIAIWSLSFIRSPNFDRCHRISLVLLANSEPAKAKQHRGQCPPIYASAYNQHVVHV
jgi:hypothetical protein